VHKTYLKTLLNPYQELYMEFSGNMNFAWCWYIFDFCNVETYARHSGIAYKAGKAYTNRPGGMD